LSYFKKYSELNLSKIHQDVLSFWIENDVFNKSIENRKNSSVFNFYEGPPSANGMPGIHHIIARTIKDLFCRYKTLKNYKVNRKAGWDTHGLPVELGVEKELGITKEDIGSKISIEEYNSICKTNVMKYKEHWEKITKEMGYWVDMKNPYVTYENKYIESVWWILHQLYKKGLIYKGHTIQPYSPKAGTALSTHELNQPGCYKNVKDTTAVAQFKLIRNDASNILYEYTKNDIYFLAWTTTPWTLPSNTALAVGKKIEYLLIETINKYTGDKISIIIAKELAGNYFKNENENLTFEDYAIGDKNIPYKIIKSFRGLKLNGLRYEQLFKYKQPKSGDCFLVLLADFVTTENGTGIVHIAPSFGSDDNLVAKKNNVGSLTLVNKQGQFTEDVVDMAGLYVKNEYYVKPEEVPSLSVDVQIVIKLKKTGLCFHSEKYEHSYPHCWRTDKPILYYPINSWFVKTTDYKEKMLRLNNTINWKPSSTGEGRFGNWLENLVDWNLSRSRFWGIPIPIWKTKDEKEELCIGSVEHLKIEIEKSISAGFMSESPLAKFIVNDFSNKNYTLFDLHRPYVDEIILVSKSGKRMYRESDLIDVWFDSGAMPYAQLHYPFENSDLFTSNFPADFIAEGVDQTRGWFFTLHAISTMLFDKVAYKNVISNGLVLDKDGNKMSKRLGNAIDPFNILKKYGADATRWYMICNAQPWDNLKFDENGIKEVQRKFFGTLFNTYSFFALYANIDKFNYHEAEIPLKRKNELDIWIISELYTLIGDVESNYENYEPTKAGRLIQEFVINKLSNWFVRLSRRRFWKGEYNSDKISAYQTLYTCLEKIAIISCPIAPFFMDNLYQDLNSVCKKHKNQSVHLANYPEINKGLINKDLEDKMALAQLITTLSLSLRKKEKIRVRQPLQKILVPVTDKKTKADIQHVEDIILQEINVKKIEYLSSDSDIVKKHVKPNFKKLGPKYGKDISFISKSLSLLNSNEIKSFEENNALKISKNITLNLEDVEIISSDIPGYSVMGNENISVALDISISNKLKEEGLARELINRIQNIRKDLLFDVTDKIIIYIVKNELIASVVKNNFTYICNETLAENIIFSEASNDDFDNVSLIETIMVKVKIIKKK
tara:strand:+ start:807 stop:4157 length:3351 start_codon:yes stop_codon:yes gene_type:complete